ncbi:MAG TPA: hypothetical protein VL285_26795, partial [Bryobacteraceae bacterium]|nr:hypothetical protein [Bryobacteraceae bacterium]
PLLWYEIRSGWATLDSFRSMPAPEPWLRRLNLLSQTLLSDPGTRSAWDGPALPAWQWILYPTLVVIALGANLRRGGAARMAGLIFALLALYLLFSPLKIEDRHFVALVPLAALLVTLAARDLRRRRPAAWIAAALAAVIYLGSAVDWNLAAARQLRATGGVGLWSNAIDKVAAYLQRNSRGRKVKVLDWGLNDSLLVLTGGQVDSAEIFQGATAGHSGTGRPWKEEIVPGGVYVLHSPETVVFPEAGDAFRRVLAEMQLPFRRTQFRQKAKGWYAEVVEVLPPP